MYIYICVYICIYNGKMHVRVYIFTYIYLEPVPPRLPFCDITSAFMHRNWVHTDIQTQTQSVSTPDKGFMYECCSVL